MLEVVLPRNRPHRQKGTKRRWKACVRQQETTLSGVYFCIESHTQSRSHPPKKGTEKLKSLCQAAGVHVEWSLDLYRVSDTKLANPDRSSLQILQINVLPSHGGYRFGGLSRESRRAASICKRLIIISQVISPETFFGNSASQSGEPAPKVLIKKPARGGRLKFLIALGFKLYWLVFNCFWQMIIWEMIIDRLQIPLFNARSEACWHVRLFNEMFSIPFLVHHQSRFYAPIVALMAWPQKGKAVGEREGVKFPTPLNKKTHSPSTAHNSK